MGRAGEGLTCWEKYFGTRALRSSFIHVCTAKIDLCGRYNLCHGNSKVDDHSLLMNLLVPFNTKRPVYFKIDVCIFEY